MAEEPSWVLTTMLEIQDKVLKSSVKDEILTTSIRSNPQSIDTYTYLSEDELEQGLEFVNGNGSAPEIARLLASDLGIPTYDLIVAQLNAAGKEVPGQRPEVEGEVDGLDPGIQTLLRRNPSPSRTTRAVSEADGNTKFFLDSVAGYESESHGGYDAMNTGGTGLVLVTVPMVLLIAVM